MGTSTLEKLCGTWQFLSVVSALFVIAVAIDVAVDGSLYAHPHSCETQLPLYFLL